MLLTPAFHHLHLNSVDPDAAIDFYIAQFPSTTRTTWAGLPALKSPSDVLVLFTKVDSPPATQPATALWHFGWYVTDVRAKLALYKTRPEVKLMPLYTSWDSDDAVFINTDTWPGAGGTLGRTRAQIAEARATGIKPLGGAGWGYMEGPDGALIEMTGNQPAERFNHVHLWQDHPLCAQLWYQKHLNAPPREGWEIPADITEATCKVPRAAEPSWPSLTRDGMYRTPRGGVVFSDVILMWYARQGDEPLARARGHIMDHIGLAVADLDAWIAKLQSEDVTFLEQPYALGDTRAVMIEGPSGEALELVEVKNA